MKILFVQESDWIKRNPHQQHHLTERLSLKGHEIRVIDYDIDWKTEKSKELLSKRMVFNDQYKIYPQAKIQVIRPGTLRLPVLEYVSLWFSHKREINRQVNEFKPDVIIGFGILNTYSAVMIAQKNKIPFIYYWIDALDKLIQIKQLQFFGKSLERSSLNMSTKVITINKKLEEYVIKLGANKEKTSVIGAGIDIKKFDIGIDGSAIREKYGIKREDILLFFMGWLYHFSGLKEVALKLAKTRDVNKNIKLLIVGDGDALMDLKKIITDNKLEGQVILVGKQPYNTIPNFISASDICILPAYTDEVIMQDIVPIKMYEYMAMGKPVIVTKLPGIIKEFSDNNGVVYVNKPEDVIFKSAQDYEIIKKYGQNARDFVKNYDWNDITEKFEKLIISTVKDDKSNN